MVDRIEVAGGGYEIRRPDATGKADGPTAGARFEDVLRESIRDVDKLQHEATTAVENLSTGRHESVAEVMTAVEKADIAFRTLMQVRNKLVEAYEELLRIRI